MWRSMQRAGVKPALATFAWMKGGVSESWKPLPAAAKSILCDESHRNNTQTSVSLHVQCRDIYYRQSHRGHGIHKEPHNSTHPIAAQGSSFSTKNSSTSQKEDAPDGRGIFTGLSLAHASLATAAFVVPGTVANALFPGVFVPQGLQTQALIRLVGCGLLGGAATCYALAKASPSASDTTRRLEAALMGFSAGSIITHVLYSPLLSTPSLLSGGLIMGATFAVPFQSYRIQDGTMHLGSIVKDYFGALPDCFRYVVSCTEMAFCSVLVTDGLFLIRVVLLSYCMIKQDQVRWASGISLFHPDANLGNNWSCLRFRTRIFIGRCLWLCEGRSILFLLAKYRPCPDDDSPCNNIYPEKGGSCRTIARLIHFTNAKLWIVGCLYRPFGGALAHARRWPGRQPAPMAGWSMERRGRGGGARSVEATLILGDFEGPCTCMTYIGGVSCVFYARLSYAVLFSVFSLSTPNPTQSFFC